ncbi:MAG: TIGR00730 family Rossman fold protein [Salaquimonas sp.]
MSKIKSICVYCGSQPGNHPVYAEAARVLGKDMASNNIRLVYGGGGSGIMGEVARAVKANHGEITGIIPEFLIPKERGNLGAGGRGDELGEVIITKDMHERKTQLFERSDAFVALPGGIGTLEEVVEIMTWAQLGRHSRPIVFANIEGFWNPMIDLMAHMAESGFIHTAGNLKPLIVNDPAEIVSRIIAAVE